VVSSGTLVINGKTFTQWKKGIMGVVIKIVELNCREISFQRSRREMPEAIQIAMKGIRLIV